MAGASKWKERFRAYAKGFKQNWELFKASKIGLVGIGIMVFFIIMAVSAPYLGLRDPILWFAPDEDIIEVNQYHRIDTNSSNYNLRPDAPPIPISNEISFRVRPKSDDPRTDRVYVTTDNTVWAVRPINGRQGWKTPTSFVADSSITTPVVVVNYGHHTEPSKADFVLLFGTASGRLYALNDSNQIEPRPPPPAGADNFSVSLDGSPVVSVAAYSGDIQPGRKGSVRMEQDRGTDLDGIDTPFVVKGPFPSGTKYRAYYTGNDSGTWQILSAASDDGLKFNKIEGRENANIRIPASGIGGDFDSQGAMDPFVLQRSDGNWSMYYVGYNGTDYTILGADSSDGMTWDKTGVVLSSSGPNDSQGMRRPWLVRNASNDWTLFYAGYNGTAWQILSATSADQGTSWTAPEIRIADANHPAVYRTSDGDYAMLFSRNVSGAPRIFGATSPDLVTWSGVAERVGVGDTLRLVDAGGLFDPLELEPHVSTGVMSPSVLTLENGTYRLYYVATFFDSRRGGSGENVAAVVSGTSLDGVTWSREHRDIYVATTASGKVYAFSAVDNQLLWQRTVADVPARVTGTPLVPINDPAYSQAFNARGSVVVVGTQDGMIRGLRTRDGGPAWNEPFDLQMEDGVSWYSPPVVAERSAIPTENGTDFADVVYAASGDGWLYALFAETGTPIPEWRAVVVAENYSRDGVPVKYTLTQLDEGNLSAPTVRGTTIYVGSSNGRAYAVHRDNVGKTIFAGDVKWVFEDPALMGVNATMALRATNLHTLDLVFFVANHDNGTPNNPADDRSAVYGVALDGELSWKQNIGGHIAGPVIVWRSEEPVIGSRGQLQPATWWGSDQGIVYAFSASGRMIAPLPPTWMEPSKSGNDYWLGTDSLGRDLFSQFMFGAQIALLVGFLAAFFSISIGVIVGLVAGYSGKRVEAILMRFTDVILVLPGLPLVIILSAVLGANIWNIILVISIVGWPGVARVIRSEVLSLKERPFIDSARVTGASNIRIMFRHVAPNILPLAFLYMTFAVSGAILTEAALSFLGLGDASTPSWGQMLEAIQRQNVLGSWWWLWPPGLGITLLSLAFYLVGRGYEQIVNPRLRRR